MKHIEKTLVSWHKTMPHMPPKQREWVADNAWRFVIVGAGLAIYGLFTLVPIVITALVLSSSINIIGPVIPYYDPMPNLGWLALTAAAVVLFVSAVVLAAAVFPMMEKRRRGWDLVFRTYAGNVVLGIVTTIMFPSVLELTVLLLIIFGAGYLAFEVRSEFAPEKKARAKVKA